MAHSEQTDSILERYLGLEWRLPLTEELVVLFQEKDFDVAVTDIQGPVFRTTWFTVTDPSGQQAVLNGRTRAWNAYLAMIRIPNPWELPRRELQKLPA
jgi:hypothetical protein